MRIINEKFETITEYDLTKGRLVPTFTVHEDATPIDNKTKWIWAEEDWENVQMYIPSRQPFFEESSAPSQLDRVEAQIAYLAMMTGNEDILEV